MTGAAAAVPVASVACAQSVPSYDFQWATIGDLNNVGYNGPTPYGLEYLVGRGRVGYQYRISRLEVTTSQWLEFINTVGRVEPQRAMSLEPFWWGAQVDNDYQGPGVQWRLRDVASAEMIPVNSISWRDAALLCNWLHNDKGQTPQAWMNGAYDASTFTFNPDGSFNDQPSHAPDAKFWIPTLDEWMKAARFDPNRNGKGQGGWWQYPYGSELPPVPGAPGVGQTSAGWIPGGGEETVFDVPLGAYTDCVSAYGLWDVSGGTSEWVEELLYPGFPLNRVHVGSYAGDPWYLMTDHASVAESTGPEVELTFGIRIASRVPSPSSFAVLLSLCVLSRRARNPQ